MKFLDNFIQKQIKLYINSLNANKENEEMQIKFKWHGVNIELSGEDIADIVKNIGGVFKNKKGDGMDGKV